MRVRGEKNIRVGIDENPNRQDSRSKKDLRCGLVLPVEYLHLGRRPVRGVDPCQSDVKLWKLTVELLDQLFQVLADRTRVNVIVVVQVLDRKIDECRMESRNVILEHRERADFVLAKIREGRL